VALPCPDRLTYRERVTTFQRLITFRYRLVDAPVSSFSGLTLALSRGASALVPRRRLQREVSRLVGFRASV
jgi:hypothetical protein